MLLVMLWGWLSPVVGREALTDQGATAGPELRATTGPELRATARPELRASAGTEWSATAPDGSLVQGVFDPAIHSVQFYPEDSETGYPVYLPSLPVPLLLQFDCLERPQRNFRVTVVHCDARWQPSRMTPQEYLTGFGDFPVRDFRPSFNTQTPYVHYSFRIPNEEMGLKCSGNYMLLVYESNRERPVLTRRFYVAENLMNIQASISLPAHSPARATLQQLNIRVLHPGTALRNPRQEVLLGILQNNRTATTRMITEPAFVRADELDYQSAQGILFPGSNEFRHFSTRDIISGVGFRSSAPAGEQPGRTLNPDLPRKGLSYIPGGDINGGFVVRADNREEPNTQAEYVRVTFSVAAQHIPAGASLFVTGQFNDYATTVNNQLRPDDNRGLYTTTLKLKQGYYDYMYQCLPRNDATESTIGDPRGIGGSVYASAGSSVATSGGTCFEGDYFETSNDYLIFVYYRPTGSRYDRIAGYRMLRSGEGTSSQQPQYLFRDLFR